MSEAIPNPNLALKKLEIFIGAWSMEMIFPNNSAPNMIGQVAFRWLEDGAFLHMLTGDKSSGLPWSDCIMGRDDSAETYSVLYYDWRGVSRIYQMSFENDEWKQWREASGFHQRFSGIFSKDHNTITAKWEKSNDGLNWEHDFNVKYSRK
jgi:hypothetical protein